MTKKVVWTSCSRLSCACLSSPTVILCLAESSLLVSQTCPDDTAMPYAFTTLEATLTKSWKSENVCQKASWTYVFSYDETLLTDPATALLQSDIVGVFCEGCLTTWVTEQVGNEILVDVDVLTDLVTITSQHGCTTSFTAISSVDTDWHVIGNSGTIDGTNFCGTIDDIPFTVRTNNKRSRRTEPFVYASTTGGDLDAPNMLDGSELNTVDGARSASLLGGGVYAQSGNPNIIAGTGDTPTTVAFGSTISGGAGNSIDPDGPPDFDVNFLGTPTPTYDYGGYSTIAGGGDNHIIWDSDPSALGAGFHAIGGGQTNAIDRAGGCCTIGGGYINFIIYDSGILDAFYANQLAGDTIGGGVTNVITGVTPSSGSIPSDVLGANFIGGGTFNTIDNGFNSTIAGGWDVAVSSNGQNYGVSVMPGPLSYNTISGGAFNNLGATQSCVMGGGAQNKIFGEADSGILGGFRNLIFANTPAAPQIDTGSSFVVTYPSPTAGAFNVILGGYANYIEEGFCSSILGGAGLKLGTGSAGYQSPVSRDFPFSEGDPALPFSFFDATDYSQVDLTAYPNIYYMGDVDLWVANTDNVARKLKLYEPNTDTDFSTPHFSSLESQAQVEDMQYVLPAVMGTPGQVLTIQSVVGPIVTLEWA